jgi:hypothetical protein
VPAPRRRDDQHIDVKSPSQNARYYYNPADSIVRDQQLDSIILLCHVPAMPSFLVVFAAHATVVACLSCLLAVLKYLLLSTCKPNKPNTNDALLTIINGVIIMCTVIAAFSLVASAAYFFKSRAWSHAAAVCSKWQPVYFLFVSVQSLVLRIIVIVVNESSAHNPCSENDNLIHAISLIWNCTILSTALSTMSCDLYAELSLALRRCTYGVFAFVLIVDAIGSVLCGNLLANKATLQLSAKISPLLLDNLITSSIASQVVLVLHFFYVSCRSRCGRGWSYGSMRFELDDCGQLSLQRLLQSTNARRESGVAASITTPMMLDASSESRYEAARGAGVFARLRHRWLQFKRRQLLRCGVFVIPCVAVQDAATGTENLFVLARPALELRCLRPLQWCADKHPKRYSAISCILVGSKAMFSFETYNLLVFSNFSLYNLILYAANLVTSILMVVHMLGFLSSKRYGLDRVAAKHIAKSFRFVVIAMLFSIDVALDARQVYNKYYAELNDFDKFWSMMMPFGTALANLYWCLCILIDCSPHVPFAVQFCISVNARKSNASSLFSSAPFRYLLAHIF